MNKRIDVLRNTILYNECVFISSFANIFYYSGFTSADAYLLISHEKAVIITDSRYTVQAKTECPDFEIFNISQGIETIFKAFPDTVHYEEKDICVSAYINLKKKLPEKSFVPSSDKITLPRQKKDFDEIRRIKSAEELTSSAFEYILGVIKPGKTEIEIASELEYFMRKNGASKLSFDTIVASGVRSSMPHGTASNKKIEAGELITLDFGCILDGYCSDMTRTVAVGNIGSQEREIYDIVLKAQNSALNNMQIGMRCADIDKLARDIIIDAGYGNNFGHSLGHSVGIEIHEAPNFSEKSEDVLENGHVVTVEPGIYIDGLFGVRIEDVVAATDDLIINLTNSTKELIIL